MARGFDVADRVSSLVGRRRSVVSLPRHPAHPGGETELALGDIARQLDSGVVVDGWSAHHLPTIATTLSIAAAAPDCAVIDLAPDVAIVGLLHAALLPDAAVSVARGDASERAAVCSVARRNGLDLDVVESIDASVQDVGSSTRTTVVVASDIGARDLDIAALPPHTTIVARVGTSRRLFDAGVRAMLHRSGYVAARLSPTTAFRQRERWWKRSRHRPGWWLLSPSPLPDGFVDEFDWWYEEFAAVQPVFAYRSPRERARCIARRYRARFGPGVRTAR